MAESPVGGYMIIASTKINKEKSLYEPYFPDEWGGKILFDLAEWKNGLAFRDISFSDYGIPVIKIAELKNGITSQTKFTNQVFDDSVFLTKNDMIFSWSGNPETSIDVFLYNLPDGWLNQHIFKVNTKEEVDEMFFFYILKYLKPNFTMIASNKQTTGLGHVTISDLKQIKVRIPPLPTQRAIAATLSCLDDKIELNNRINANLEAQAQTIFKSWFVDFEPLKDGEFVDSESGRIPKGWRVGKLSDLVNIKYGKAHQSLNDGKFPVYGSGGLMRYAEKPLYCKESVLIPRKGTLNNIMYITEPFWTVDTMFYTEMKKTNISTYIYQFVKRKDLASMNAGTAVPSMTTEILNALNILIPPHNVLQEFSDVTADLYNKQKANYKESHALASIRDALLPKLMSGEIEVKND